MSSNYADDIPNVERPAGTRISDRERDKRSAEQDSAIFELSYDEFVRKDYSQQNLHTCEYGSTDFVRELLEVRLQFVYSDLRHNEAEV